MLNLQPGQYDVNFKWMCEGEGELYDYARAALVPATTPIVNGFELPSGAIYADGGEFLVGSDSWTDANYTFDIPSAGRYYLTFIWENDNTGNYTPAAIDDIEVKIHETGIETPEETALQLFPHPATDNTKLSISGITGETTLEINDLNGRCMHSETVKLNGNDKISINTADLPAGVYFVRIGTHFKKLIKK